MLVNRFLFLLLFLLFLAACTSPSANPGDTAVTFQVLSPAFANATPIPRTHTCQGQDVSPPLTFSSVPAGTKSIALIVDDPDAPDPAAPKMVWDHWVVWNIPPNSAFAQGSAPAGAVVGRNSWSKNVWGGPCPPIGTHRYFFKAFALDTLLELPPAADKAALLAAIRGHTLAQAELVGTYRKS